jgi:hypothetical protein
LKNKYIFAPYVQGPIRQTRDFPWSVSYYKKNQLSNLRWHLCYSHISLLTLFAFLVYNAIYDSWILSNLFCARTSIIACLPERWPLLFDPGLDFVSIYDNHCNSNNWTIDTFVGILILLRVLHHGCPRSPVSTVPIEIQRRVLYPRVPKVTKKTQAWGSAVRK